MLRRLSLCLAVVAIPLVLSHPASANLITNGDFSAGFAGWNWTGNVTATDGGLTGAAFFGAGDLPDNGVIYQSFATMPGQQYDLLFIYFVGGLPTIPQSVVVQVSGTPIDQSITQLSNDDGSANSVTYTDLFTATTDMTTLTFSDASTNSHWTDGAITAVSVEVPEPASMALLAVGLAGVRATRRRAKRRS